MFRRSVLRLSTEKRHPVERIKTTTRDYIEGTEIVKELGVVVGNSVLSRNVGMDILTRFKALVGGELYPYTSLLEDATEDATKRVMNEARLVQANGVLRLRYQMSALSDPIAGTFIAVMATGTAVRFVQSEADVGETLHVPIPTRHLPEKSDSKPEAEAKSA